MTKSSTRWTSRQSRASSGIAHTRRWATLRPTSSSCLTSGYLKLLRPSQSSEFSFFFFFSSSYSSSPSSSSHSAASSSTAPARHTTSGRRRSKTPSAKRGLGPFPSCFSRRRRRRSPACSTRSSVGTEAFGSASRCVLSRPTIYIILSLFLFGWQDARLTRRPP